MGYPTKSSTVARGRTLFDHLPFTFPFNLNGWPAAHTLRFTSEGLPCSAADCGAVASGLRGACNAAAAFEAAQPVGQRPPARVTATARDPAYWERKLLRAPTGAE